MLTAIGHDGHIYAVEKSKFYDETFATVLVSDLCEDAAKVAEKYNNGALSFQEAAEALHRLSKDCLEILKDVGVNFYE